MYKDLQKFVPFEHENSEFKNNLINIARTQNKAEVQGALSAVLIYANLVDYLARHLLQNLLKMTTVSSFKYFGGILFFDGSNKRTTLPLGDLCRELKNFEFPNKKDFLLSLDEFNKLRISVVHNLMQLSPEDATNSIDKNMDRIGEIAEDLLLKYNTISGGLITVWNAFSGPVQTQTQERQK